MIGYITGTVEKAIPTQYGVGLVVVESYKDRDGQTREKKPVAWFDSDPGVKIGERITVSGIVAAKVDEWTGNDGVVRHTAKVSLSSAKLELGNAVHPAPAAPTAPAAPAPIPGWDAPAVSAADTPF